MTHYAIIRSSGRVIPVIRLGRLLIILGHRQSVSTCAHDNRFFLLPKGWFLGFPNTLAITYASDRTAGAEAPQKRKHSRIAPKQARPAS